MNCPGCHAEVSPGAKFCGKCGTKLEVVEEAAGVSVTTPSANAQVTTQPVSAAASGGSVLTSPCREETGPVRGRPCFTGLLMGRPLRTGTSPGRLHCRNRVRLDERRCLCGRVCCADGVCRRASRMPGRRLARHHFVARMGQAGSFADGDELRSRAQLLREGLQPAMGSAGGSW